MKKLMKMLGTVALGVFAASIGMAQTLVVSPANLSVVGTPLQGATAASLEVYNSASHSTTSYYTTLVATDCTWMTVSPATGNSTGEVDTITLTFVTTNLTEGMYSSTLTIAQTNATTSSKAVPVVLKINQDENLGIAIGPGSIATAASGVAIGSRTARAVAIGAGTIQIGGGVNSTVGSVGIGTNRWIP
jgi:hypothetical protein